MQEDAAPISCLTCAVHFAPGIASCTNNSVLLTDLKFSCTVKNFLCPLHTPSLDSKAMILSQEGKKNDDVKHNFSTLLARCYVVTSFCNI